MLCSDIADICARRPLITEGKACLSLPAANVSTELSSQKRMSQDDASHALCQLHVQALYRSRVSYSMQPWHWDCICTTVQLDDACLCKTMPAQTTVQVQIWASAVQALLMAV